MTNNNLEIRLDFINNKLSIKKSFIHTVTDFDLNLTVTNIKNITDINQQILTLIAANQLTLSNLENLGNFDYLNQSEVACGN